MDLYDYYYQMKKTHRITQKELAQALGISPIYLSNLLFKRTMPSFQLALKIEEYTEKKVNAWEFMNSIHENINKKEKS